MYAIDTTAIEPVTNILDSIPAFEQPFPKTKRGRLLPRQTTFNTPKGKMNAAQYAAYVASLIPATLSRGYETLPCGHKFTKAQRPRYNCDMCWTAYWQANPMMAVGMNQIIARGEESDLVAHFGTKAVKRLKRFVAEFASLFAEESKAAA